MCHISYKDHITYMDTGSCRCYHYTAAIPAGSYLYYYTANHFCHPAFFNLTNPLMPESISFCLAEYKLHWQMSFMFCFPWFCHHKHGWKPFWCFLKMGGFGSGGTADTHQSEGSLVRFLAPAVTCWSVLGKNPIWARWLLHLCVSVHMNC